MKILLIGATGITGQELVKQGLERGHTISALVRNPNKFHVPKIYGRAWHTLFKRNWGRGDMYKKTVGLSQR